MSLLMMARRGALVSGGGAFAANLPPGLTLYTDTTYGQFVANETYANGLAVFSAIKQADDAAIPSVGGSVTVDTAIWRNVTDATAPYKPAGSSPNCTDIGYVEGGAGNGFCDSVISGTAPQTWVRAYFAMSMLVSPNYVWHSNAEKFFYPNFETAGRDTKATSIGWRLATTDNPNSAVCGWEADCQVPAQPSGTSYVLQSDANPARMQKGVWQKVEVYVQVNTPGNGDGVLRIWVDGVIAIEKTDMRYTPSTYFDAPQSTIRAAKFEGVRGGGASTVLVPTGGMYRRFDRLAFYASSSFEGESNEPVGYTQMFSNPLSVAPPIHPSGADSYGFKSFQFYASPLLSIQTDGSGNESDPNYLRVLFPSGMAGGGYEHPFQAGTGFSSGGNKTEMYVRIRFRLSSAWSDNGNVGTKFFFFSQRTGDTGIQTNHYIGLTDSGALSPVFGIQRNGWTYGGNASETYYTAESPLAKNVWHTLEVQVVANTVVAGVSESNNGIGRVWINGALWIEHTDLCFFHRSMTPLFDELYCNPTFGGGVNTVPADQYFDIDHWYVSAKA